MRHASRSASLLSFALVLASPAFAASSDVPTLFATWGTYGSGLLQFDHPHGLAVDHEGFVYVADQGNNRVQKLTSDGRLVLTFGAPIADPADEDEDNPYPPYLYHPVGVAIGPDGVVYVSEHQHHRVSRWTKTGTYLGAFGLNGTPGDLAHPVDIAIDGRAGHVYVANSSRSRIDKFTLAGAHVQSIGEDRVENPYALALDGQGNLYTSDYHSNRIVKLTTSGQYVTEWRAPAAKPLDAVRQMVVDPEGNLYACDANGDRVVKFTTEGGYLGEFPIPLIMEDKPHTYPAGIGMDRSGANVYVTTWGSGRVHHFRFGNQPPDCAGARAKETTIWPPNHRLVPVEIEGITDPDGDSIAVRVTAIVQDEPVFSSGGRLCPDAMIDDAGMAQVRAERETGSNANGRVYRVRFEAMDGRGGRSEGEIQLCVPAHGRGSECVADTASFNSLESCRGRVLELDALPSELGLGGIERNGELVTIEYRLPATADVELSVFDVAGRRLTTLERSVQAAGVHRAEWNARGVSRGVYFCRLRSDDRVLARTIVMP